jgi:GT2 family glycosyltransferase
LGFGAWDFLSRVVSIIIVTFNACEYVRRCLDSIRARTRAAHEIIVIDNASRAETRDYLRSETGIRLTLNDENVLWCAACNQGMKLTDPGAEFFLLLNPDVEALRDDWIDIMLRVMQSADNVGMVGPVHRYSGIGPVWGSLDGHCILLRRKLVEEIGPFDCERFPMSGAPSHYAIRAYRAGWIYKVLHRDDQILVHHGDKSREDADGPAPPKAPRPDYLTMLKEQGMTPTFPSQLRRSLDRRFPAIKNFRRFYATARQTR